MIVQLVKIDGNLRPLEEHKQALADYKARISEGQVVDAEFRTAGETRRAAQSRLFHKIRDRYAHSLGYELEFAKSELCIQRGIALTMDDALVESPSWPGHIVEMWGQQYIRKSTAAYTMKEMNDLIEGAKQSCFEANVDIDDLLTEFDVRVSA